LLRINTTCHSLAFTETSFSTYTLTPWARFWADEPILYLNGDGVVDAENTCKINNMCFPSLVSPSYAPAGKVALPNSTESAVVFCGTCKKLALAAA
jgi:hypothetical protein